MGLRSLNIAYTAENRYKINQSVVYIKVKPLTHRWVRGFETAKQAIEYSSGKCRGHYMGAAIFSGNRVLSTGNNLLVKTKPGNSVVKTDGTAYDISCHAEQIAVDRVKHRESNTSNLIMYIVRVNGNDKYANSRPCAMCVDYLKKYGIRTIRFINELGIPEELKLTN